jgi:hypothetical protein
MFKRKLRSALAAFAPDAATQLFAARARRHQHRLETGSGLVDETRRYVSKYGKTVLSGPFLGMAYPPTLDRYLTTKLMGTYEMELHSFLEAAISAEPERVINVGSAEGYYAVGLALRLPEATVLAFDADRWARKRTAEMAQVNGCANLQRKGLCTDKWLAQNVRGNTLVVMDCEGCEAVLTAFVPSCRNYLLLSWWAIELHETESPGVTQRLLQRFKQTHHIELCTSRPRNREDLPDMLKSEIDISVLKWMTEYRNPGQQWLLCRPQNT